MIQETLQRTGYWSTDQGDDARRHEVEALAAQAKGGFNRKTGEFLGGLREQGLILPGKSVLVLACGTGEELPVLADHFDRVAGVDINPVNQRDAEALIRYFRLEDRVSFEVGDATALGYPDNSFDVVYAQLFDQHVTPEQRERVFAERKRVVKPGGLVIVQDLDIVRDGFDESWELNPTHPLFEKLYKIMLNSYELRGGNPKMGRELEGWFNDSGLTDIVARSSYVIESTREHPMHRAHPAIFKRQAGLFVKQGLAFPEELTKDIAELEKHMFGDGIVRAKTPRMYSVAAIAPGK